jgi:hypothetical protein
MGASPSFTSGARSLLLLVFVVGCSAGAAKPPLRLADLQGEWIARPYLEAVRRTKQTLAPQERTPALSFTVRRASGGGFEMERTNFHESVTQPIESFETTSEGARLVLGEGERPDPVTVERLGTKKRRCTGILRVGGVWSGAPAEAYVYARVPGSVRKAIHEAVLAGEYRDAAGRSYVFTPAGRATWPDREFDYEVSLDPSEACCEYFQHADPKGVGGQARYGYAWKDGALQVFRVFYPVDGCPISCEPEPMLVLRPVVGEASSLLSPAPPVRAIQGDPVVAAPGL